MSASSLRTSVWAITSLSIHSHRGHQSQSANRRHGRRRRCQHYEGRHRQAPDSRRQARRAYRGRRGRLAQRHRIAPELRRSLRLHRLVQGPERTRAPGPTLPDAIHRHRNGRRYQGTIRIRRETEGKTLAGRVMPPCESGVPSPRGARRSRAAPACRLARLC